MRVRVVKKLIDSNLLSSTHNTRVTWHSPTSIRLLINRYENADLRTQRLLETRRLLEHWPRAVHSII